MPLTFDKEVTIPNSNAATVVVVDLVEDVGVEQWHNQGVTHALCCGVMDHIPYKCTYHVALVQPNVNAPQENSAKIIIISQITLFNHQPISINPLPTHDEWHHYFWIYLYRWCRSLKWHDGVVPEHRCNSSFFSQCAIHFSPQIYHGSGLAQLGNGTQLNIQQFSYGP